MALRADRVHAWDGRVWIGYPPPSSSCLHASVTALPPSFPADGKTGRRDMGQQLPNLNDSNAVIMTPSPGLCPDTGVAGLQSLRELARVGCDVLCLEASSCVGGVWSR